jgi:hypothetical protein
MNEEVKALFELHKDWFLTNKKIWQPEEVAVAYVIFNLETGENRVDTGCGSCRRAVVTRVKKLFLQYVK